MNPMYDCSGWLDRLMTGALKKNLNGSGPKKPMPFAGVTDGGE